MQQEILVKRTGIRRVLYTFVHSYNGFKWLCTHETAFQQELLLFLPLTVFAFWLDLPALHTLLLLLSMLFVLFAEMVNTAIEAVVDRISLEYHPLSGIAKNIGSALVMFSFIGLCLVWGVVLWIR
ncbi:diacylglycerol kinase [Photobacterium sp. TY1-4]|uniref:diacylglycerol kinase n=1 Tax=Photobacterium sp. TY1-4 TaxID=2899122 RepID=UPI0021C1DCD9|nr:diacylglycerol kinase [Photobacterium sp. TY1-4]UXI03691.1 diacylglycerol kinase [Photobacterium sp. TY1-4]